MGQTTSKPAVLLTADQLLGADDLRSETMDIPEWGGAVKVQALSVRALNECNRKATVGGEVDAEKITVQVVIEGLVEPKLTDDMAGQLAMKSAAVINRIGAKIFELSGVDDATLAGNEARFSEGTG